MASFHVRGTDGCTECLHTDDEPTEVPIPPVAFVSFQTGLLTAVHLLRHRASAFGTGSDDAQINVLQSKEGSHLPVVS